VPLSATSGVSVVIPVWNGARTLAETLASVKNQTFRDFHIGLVWPLLLGGNLTP